MGQVSTTIRVVDKGSKTLNNILNKINAINASFNKMASQAQKANSAIQNASSTNNKFASSLSNTNSALKKTTNQTSLLTTKLRRLASAYLGVMGAQAAIGTADQLTSATNKFTTYGGNAGVADTAAFSETTLTKIFNAAQDSYSGFVNMTANVAKSLTLASDAFGNTFEEQTDNAIKFQEIMAKSYALGGASPAEQSSSMYQLVQALGSGTLQGDELRSVRDGAPLAYKAIEQFAQGLFNTRKSLKELASEGLITSDIVVGAVLDMEQQTNVAFENIRKNMTFGQMWTVFKNDALDAFYPVLVKLREIGNNDAFKFLASKAISALKQLAKIIYYVLDAVESVFEFIQQNWTQIKGVIMGIATALMVLAGAALAQTIVQLGATIAQFVILHWQLVLVAAAIGGIVYYLTVVGVTAQTVGELLIGIGLALFAVGLLVGSPFYIVIGILMVLAGVFLRFTDIVVASIYTAVAFILNMFSLLITYGTAPVIALAAIWDAFANFFGNLFNDPIAAIIRAFEGLAQAVLGILERIASAIDAIFGSNLASVVQGWSSGLSGWADSTVAKYGNGTYEEKSTVAKDLSGIIDGITDSLQWDITGENGAWQSGLKKGAEIQSGINDWIGNVGDSIFGTLSGFGDDRAMSNFDMAGLSSKVGDIAGDTGSISKSMKLAEEDLTYLREIAETEAINRYTTAKIVVHQQNENHIGNDMDLDGVMRRFTDDIIEATNIQAEGVHIS